jgi:C1A family cysteine protease
MAEVKRVLNVIPSKQVERDWQFEHAEQAGKVSAAGAPPQAVDLREAWWKIGDQRDTGSCVGWGTADAVLRWHFVKASRLRRTQTLSVRFIWMASKEMDEYTSYPSTFLEAEGTSLKSALDIARKFGVVWDSDLSFKTARLYPGEPKTLLAKAAGLKIASYFNLGRNLDNWRRWLAEQGPILTRLDVDQTWQRATQTGGNLDDYHSEGPAGHCVALVGYTADRFIVRNSWGIGWGDKGFAYASLGYAQNAFTEAYGVTLY